MPDYFGAASTIQSRLREKVALVSDAQINVVASIGSAMELLQVTPAVFVIPWEDIVYNDDRYGVSAVTEQTWLILIVARKVDDVSYGALSLAEAGTIMYQVVTALQGFNVNESGAQQLHRVPSPKLGAHGSMIDYEKGVTAIPALFAMPVYSLGQVNED